MAHANVAIYPTRAGIPQSPATPWGVSRKAGEIVLALSTREAGIDGSLHTITFLVNTSRVVNSTNGATKLYYTDHALMVEGYVDGAEVEFKVQGLTVGDWYTFEAAVRNVFGVSAASETSPAIQVGGKNKIAHFDLLIMQFTVIINHYILRADNLSTSFFQLVLRGLRQHCQSWVVSNWRWIHAFCYLLVLKHLPIV